MKFFDKTRTKIQARFEALRTTVRDHNRNTLAEALKLKELAFSEEYNNYFASVSFVPFVGWLIPLYLKKEDSFCQEQAKSGFYMALLFTSAALALIFIGIFLSRDWRIARLIDVVLVYLVYLAYFGFCAYGIHASVNNRRAELLDRIPFTREIRGLIEL